MLKRRIPATAEYLEECHHALSEMLGGDFGPRYFNRPEVLAAERREFPLMDAMLAHVLKTKLTPAKEEEARALVQKVVDGLLPKEFENRCHNACAALFLMLDDIGVPSVVMRGHVHGVNKGTGATFYRTAYNDNFPSETPGHSWLVTPFAPVVDLTLRHQNFFEYNPGFEKYKASIPCPMVGAQKQWSKPDKGWYFANGKSLTAHVLGDVLYRQNQDYAAVLGWGLYEDDLLAIRYLPQMITVFDADDLSQVNIKIGGLNPAAFLARG